VKWLNGVSLAAPFEGEFSGVTRSYAGKGVAHINGNQDFRSWHQTDKPPPAMNVGFRTADQ
jgi:hypothetical protein